MGVLYQGDATSPDGSNSLIERLKNTKHEDGLKAGQSVFNQVTAFAFLMFILLYFPCVAVVAAVKKESGKWRWATFMVTYTTAIAWLIAFLVNQVGGFLIG